MKQSPTDTSKTTETTEASSSISISLSQRTKHLSDDGDDGDDFFFYDIDVSLGETPPLHHPLALSFLCAPPNNTGQRQ